ncbi:MAG: hypothetical protein KY468_18030 [Armatimonadetes bacterium]|nr:hypothetical protein [Armatimonadota bacterium]
MTKVNLLPDYIWEGQRLRRTAMIVASLVVLELVALGFWYMQTNTALADVTAERDEWQVKAAAVDEINTKAEAITAAIKPITDKVDYITQIIEHNQKFPALFERTNMYTYYRVGYRQLQPQVSVLNMTANARSVGDIGRYLLNIQRAKDTFTAVSITSQMPGWPSQDAGDGGGGYAGGASAYTPTNPYVPSSVAAGATNAYASAYGAPGGYGGYPGGAAVAAAPAAPRPPQLIDFTAVGQLTQRFQLTPPAYAAAGGATDPAAAGGAGYGGYPGASAYPGASGYPAGGANGGGANGGS